MDDAKYIHAELTKRYENQCSNHPISAEARYVTVSNEVRGIIGVEVQYEFKTMHQGWS